MLWKSSRDNYMRQQFVPDMTRSVTSSNQKKQNIYDSVYVRKIDRYGMPEEALEHSAVWRIGSDISKAKIEHGANWMLHQARANDNCDILSHYGVPGMHWGEITKEYVPKGYYKQRTMTAAQYRNRKRQKNTVSPQYQASKNAGKRVGDAFFQDARRKQEARRRQAYEAAHPKEKGPDIVDKATKKAFDHFSLGAYSQLASKFIKDTAQNKAIEYLKKRSGKVIKVGGKYAGSIGKVVSMPVSLAGKGVIAGGHGLERLTKTGIKKVPKGLVQVGKFVGKAGKSTIKGLSQTSKWYRSHRSEIRSSINAGRSFLARVANTGHHVSRVTGTAIKTGSKLVQTGAQSLANILKKVKRFR